MFFKGAKKTTTSENYMLFCYIRSKLKHQQCRGCSTSSSFFFFCSLLILIRWEISWMFGSFLYCAKKKKKIPTHTINFTYYIFVPRLTSNLIFFSPFIHILRILRRLENLSKTNGRSEEKGEKQKIPPFPFTLTLKSLKILFFSFILYLPSAAQEWTMLTRWKNNEIPFIFQF